MESCSMDIGNTPSRFYVRSVIYTTLISLLYITSRNSNATFTIYIQHIYSSETTRGVFALSRRVVGTRVSNPLSTRILIKLAHIILLQLRASQARDKTIYGAT